MARRDFKKTKKAKEDRIKKEKEAKKSMPGHLKNCPLAAAAWELRNK